MAVCACMRASFHTLGVGGSEGAGISGHKAGQKVTALLPLLLGFQGS